MNDEAYLPLIYLTFNFYTKSKRIADGNNSLTYTELPADIASKEQYLKDRLDMVTKYIPSSSILLIDGPLVGGQITQYNVNLNNKLLERDIIPIYFVKNSDSSLVIDNFPKLKGKYNSDFEWAFKNLSVGERSSLIKYTDLSDPLKTKNKIFSYVKAFNAPPCRVEFDQNTYSKFSSRVEDIFNVIYYLLLAQGNKTNPQARLIAIAEQYAREALKVIDFDEVIHRTGIQPTMNYTRFGW